MYQKKDSMQRELFQKSNFKKSRDFFEKRIKPMRYQKSKSVFDFASFNGNIAHEVVVKDLNASRKMRNSDFIEPKLSTEMHTPYRSIGSTSPSDNTLPSIHFSTIQNKNQTLSINEPRRGTVISSHSKLAIPEIQPRKTLNI